MKLFVLTIFVAYFAIAVADKVRDNKIESEIRANNLQKCVV